MVQEAPNLARYRGVYVGGIWDDSDPDNFTPLKTFPAMLHDGKLTIQKPFVYTSPQAVSKNGKRSR